MSGISNYSPAGQSGYLLPTGYLSTLGSQIVDANGNDVRIASVGYFTWNGASSQQIQSDIAGIKAAGFNTVRIPWQNAQLSAELPYIDQVVAAATNAGIKVILDHHADETPSASNGWLAQQPNGLPIDSGPGTDGTDGAGDAGTVTIQKFVSDWQNLAQHFAGNATVIGFDLDNEPLANGGQSTWGTGSPTDLRQIYQQAGNAIQSVDPGALIIAEGPQDWTGTNLAGTGKFAGYGDLSLASKNPVTLNVANKVVYSVHDYYFQQEGNGTAAIPDMNADFGYLVSQNIAPVWIGEMGASLDGTDSDPQAHQLWAQTLADYMNGKDGSLGGPTFTAGQQGMGGDWWAWGNLTGDSPDGTLNPDGSLRSEQKSIYSQLQFVPAATGGRHHLPQHRHRHQRLQALQQAPVRTASFLRSVKMRTRTAMARATRKATQRSL